MDNLARVRIAPLLGLYDGWTTPPNSADTAQDLEVDPRGGLRECGGYDQIVPDANGVSPFSGLGKVKSLFWFSQHNGGPQYLLWEQGTSLYVFNGSVSSSAKWDTLASSRYATSSPWAGSQYAAVGNNVWIVNGVDAPLRYDGITTYRAGFSTPAPIPSAAGFAQGFVWGTSANGLGVGDPSTATTTGGAAVAYVLTEVNEFGTESPPSPVAAQLTWETAVDSAVPPTKYFARINIPSRSRTDIVAQRLYRTMNSRGLGVNEGATYYLVQEFRGGRSTVYVDDTPDSYLGAALDPSAFGTWPNGAKFIGHFKGCLFVAGMPSGPDIVAYSSPTSIENFPPANYFRIGDPDSGEITGIYPTRNALVVLKRRGIYLVTGNPVSGFEARTLTKDVGCSGVNTVRELPGVGLVFASDAGVYVLPMAATGQDFGQPVHISVQIQDFWQFRVNRPALANAAGAIYHAAKEYWLAVPVDGQPDNSVVLVYHYERGFWTVRPTMPFACMVETRDHRGLLFLGSADDTNAPGVHYYSHWPTDKSGTAIAPTYKSNALDLQSVYEHAHVKEVAIQAVTYGKHPLRLRYYLDGKPTTVNTQTRSAQDPEYERPVWDTAVWSTDATWNRFQPTVIRFSVEGVGKDFAWEAGTTAQRMQIIEVEIGHTPGQKRNIRALDTALATGTGS